MCVDGVCLSGQLEAWGHQVTEEDEESESCLKEWDRCLYRNNTRVPTFVEKWLECTRTHLFTRAYEYETTPHPLVFRLSRNGEVVLAYNMRSICWTL